MFPGGVLPDPGGGSPHSTLPMYVPRTYQWAASLGLIAYGFPEASWKTAKPMSQNLPLQLHFPDTLWFVTVGSETGTSRICPARAWIAWIRTQGDGLGSCP